MEIGMRIQNVYKESPQFHVVAKVVVGGIGLALRTSGLAVAVFSLRAAAGAAACVLNENYCEDLTDVGCPKNPLALISVIGFLTATGLWKMGTCCLSNFTIPDAFKKQE